jgi:hypothetical protein
MTMPSIPTHAIASISNEIDWKKTAKSHPDETLLDVVYGDADRSDAASVSERLHAIVTRDALPERDIARLRANGHWRSIDPMTEILLRREGVSIAGLAALSAVMSELSTTGRHLLNRIAIRTVNGICKVDCGILSRPHNLEKGCVTGEADVSVPLVLPDGKTMTWARTMAYGLPYDPLRAAEMIGNPLSDLIGDVARFAGDPPIALVTGNDQHGMQLRPARLPATISLAEVETMDDDALLAAAQNTIPNDWIDADRKVRSVIATMQDQEGT